MSFHQMLENAPAFWNHLYTHSRYREADWYEPLPVTSIPLITKLKLGADSRIIDVGAGPGLLARPLVALGYQDVTLLDFSSAAINHAEREVSELSANIKLLCNSVFDLNAEVQYNLWHDRATFHLLTDASDRMLYLRQAYHSIASDGYLVLGVYSRHPPSAKNILPVSIYSEEAITEFFNPLFKKISVSKRQHITPDYRLQPFLFAVFQKR